jgi:hypothetical protein
LQFYSSIFVCVPSSGGAGGSRGNLFGKRRQSRHEHAEEEEEELKGLMDDAGVARLEREGGLDEGGPYTQEDPDDDDEIITLFLKFS